jgi:hypothetical protein
MSGSDHAGAATTATNWGGIPRRDYFILPLLSLVTVVVLFIVAEAVTRVVWYEQRENACVLPGEGYNIKPNCTARTKSAEGLWSTFRFNECGYRSNTSCGPVPPGTLRIAIIGASVSQGYNIPYEDSYFALTAAELSRACGRPVDVQNLGKPGSSPLFTYRRIDEALALKPDLVLMPLAPFDIEQQIDPQELAARNEAARPIKPQAVRETRSLLRRLQLLITESRTVLVAEHFLLQNRDTYLRLYLNYGDKADFLRQPFTPAWKQRFDDVDVIIGDMTAKFHAAGIQFVVMPVPSRAEAAVLSAPRLPPGVDGFAYGRELENISARHGATYVDLMEPFSKIPNSQDLFLIVDGHVTSAGQKVIARALTRKLLDGSSPAFAGCTLPPDGENGRTVAAP